MKKESFYFSHDYHARNDRKLIKVNNKFGMSGIGVYWCLVEMLYEDNGKILISELNFIASEFKVPEVDLTSIINDFDLFKSNAKYFWSESVKLRLEKRLEKSNKAKESIRKRWQNTNVLRTNNDRNTIKESKGKEIYKESDFSIFWDLYDKKVGDKEKLKKKWQHLSKQDHEKILQFIPKYKLSQPDKKYRKNPETFLNNKSWNDEIIIENKVQPTNGILSAPPLKRANVD